MELRRSVARSHHNKLYIYILYIREIIAGGSPLSRADSAFLGMGETLVPALLGVLYAVKISDKKDWAY